MKKISPIGRMDITLKQSAKASSKLLKEVNEMIDLLCDMRETMAAMDKIITDSLFPLPVETLANPPKKIRKSKIQHEKDLETLAAEKIPEDKFPSEASVDRVSSVSQECCTEADAQ